MIQQDWEKSDGYYVATCRISRADIPELIELACKWGDPNWPGQDSASDLEGMQLLPVTAWRALAEMQCSESVEPLIGMLRDLDDFDDWSLEDLPHVFGKIGGWRLGRWSGCSMILNKPPSFEALPRAGIAAGFDMATQQGAAEFMEVYNRSRRKSAAPVTESGTIVSRHARVGRNDPCPCGSGKKYKKCCLRAS